MNNTWTHILLLILLGLILLVPGSGRLPLMDRDEPRFAQATVEMMERSDWVIPTFNGEYRFDKPPLTYWVMSAGYRLVGPNELGGRLHSIISSILIALLLYQAGSRLFSPRIGLASGAVWLTFLQVLIHGRTTVADMPMILCVAVAQFALFDLLNPGASAPPSRLSRPLLYGSLALGFLAKGPIAWFVPLLTVLLFRFVFYRKNIPWRRLQLWWGVPVVLLLVAIWGVPALLQTQGLYWDEGMGTHVIDRGFKAFNGRMFLPIYYPFTAFLSLFPWSAAAGFVLISLRRHYEVRRAFLISWFLAPFIIFTFYKTQLPHYIMPGFPAYALLLGVLAGEFDRTYFPRWSRILAAFVLILFGTLALLLFGAALLPGAPPALRTILCGAATALAALTFTGWCGLRRRVLAASAGALLTGLSILLVGAGLRTVSPAAQLGPLFRATPGDTAFMGFRFREPSLVWYSNRRWSLVGRADLLEKFARGDGNRVVLVQLSEQNLGDKLRHKEIHFSEKDKARRAKVFELFTQPDWQVAAEFNGLNAAKGEWVKLRVYRKYAQNKR